MLLTATREDTGRVGVHTRASLEQVRNEAEAKDKDMVVELYPRSDSARFVKCSATCIRCPN